MTDQASNPAQDRIYETIEELGRAIGAKDAERVMSCYAPDAINFSLAPPLRSAPPDATYLESWFATWDGPIGIEAKDLRITADGEIAMAASLNRMTGVKTDGEMVDLRYRATLGLRKIDGHWKIVHEHESMPFYMDGSYKAAIDLVP
ncbi:MAG: nuclear transport factor 2 family protein [Alphaproteobacteria bacterium]